MLWTNNSYTPPATYSYSIYQSPLTFDRQSILRRRDDKELRPRFFDQQILIAHRNVIEWRHRLSPFDSKKKQLGRRFWNSLTIQAVCVAEGWRWIAGPVNVLCLLGTGDLVLFGCGMVTVFRHHSCWCWLNEEAADALGSAGGWCEWTQWRCTEHTAAAVVKCVKEAGWMVGCSRCRQIPMCVEWRECCG